MRQLLNHTSVFPSNEYASASKAEASHTFWLTILNVLLSTHSLRTVWSYLRWLIFANLETVSSLYEQTALFTIICSLKVGIEHITVEQMVVRSLLNITSILFNCEIPCLHHLSYNLPNLRDLCQTCD